MSKTNKAGNDQSQSGSEHIAQNPEENVVNTMSTPAPVKELTAVEKLLQKQRNTPLVAPMPTVTPDAFQTAMEDGDKFDALDGLTDNIQIVKNPDFFDNLVSYLDGLSAANALTQLYLKYISGTNRQRKGQQSDYVAIAQTGIPMDIAGAIKAFSKEADNGVALWDVCTTKASTVTWTFVKEFCAQYGIPLIYLLLANTPGNVSNSQAPRANTIVKLDVRNTASNATQSAKEFVESYPASILRVGDRGSLTSIAQVKDMFKSEGKHVNVSIATTLATGESDAISGTYPIYKDNSLFQVNGAIQLPIDPNNASAVLPIGFTAFLPAVITGKELVAPIVEHSSVLELPAVFTILNNAGRILSFSSVQMKDMLRSTDAKYDAIKPLVSALEKVSIVSATYISMNF